MSYETKLIERALKVERALKEKNEKLELESLRKLWGNWDVFKKAVLGLKYTSTFNVLKDTAESGPLEAVNQLLETLDLSKVSFNEWALILWAAIRTHGVAVRKDQWAVVERFLQIPTICENITDSNNSFFRHAAETGSLIFLNLLLEIPEVVNQAAILENRALRDAAEKGHLAVVDRLLKIPEVEKNAASKENYALRAAVHIGDLAIVNRLLQVPDVIKNISVRDNGALRNAAQRGHWIIFNRLLRFPEVSKNVTARENDALHAAAAIGNDVIVSRLLMFKEVKTLFVARVPLPKNSINCPLRVAAKNGHVSVVCQLIEVLIEVGKSLPNDVVVDVGGCLEPITTLLEKRKRLKTDIDNLLCTRNSGEPELVNIILRYAGFLEESEASLVDNARLTTHYDAKKQESSKKTSKESKQIEEEQNEDVQVAIAFQRKAETLAKANPGR